MLRQSLQKYSTLKQAQSRSKSGKAPPSDQQENKDPSITKIDFAEKNDTFLAATPTPRHLQLLTSCPPTSWYSPPGSLGSNGTPILFTVKKSLLRTPLSDLSTTRSPLSDNDNNVKVVVRVRPSNDDPGAIKPVTISNKEVIAVKAGNEVQHFTFDYIADAATSQETFFKAVGRPMVENCLAGYNSSVFAFGQTGSGKTYTMLGPLSSLDIADNSDEDGLIPRIFRHLFLRIADTENAKRVGREVRFLCKVSLLEIYQEVITDLLHSTTSRLVIREDLRKGTYVEGLSEEVVTCVADIVSILQRGLAHRKVAETRMNPESSRSHLLLRCTVESKCTEDGMTSIRTARLDLVDLAGSERQKMTESEGERLREATSINLSLSALGLVIRKLVAGEPHIPYRDSKLTFLMQDSLGGNAKTVFIAAVSPETGCTKETCATLKFAQRAKQIRNKAVINEDTEGEATLLLQENARLREELEAFKALQLANSATFPSSHLLPSDDSANLEVANQLSAALSLNQSLEHRLSLLQEQNMQLKRERDNLDLIQQQAHAQMALLVEAQLNARRGIEEEPPMTDLSEKLTAAQRKIEIITRGRDTAKSEKIQLETKVAEMEVRLENADSVIINLQETLAKAKQEREELEGDVEALHRKCECMQLQARDVEANVSALALECENLHRAVGDLTTENEALRTSLARAEGTTEQLSSELLACRNEAEQARVRADAARLNASSFQSMLETMTAKNSGLEDEAESLHNQLKALTSQLSVARSERDEALHDVANFQTSLINAIQERDNLQKEAGAAAENIQQLEHDCERCQVDYSELQTVHQGVLQEKRELTALCQDLSDKLLASEAELSKSTEALKSSATEREQMHEQLEGAGQTVSELTDQLEQSDKATQVLEAKLKEQVEALALELAQVRRDAESRTSTLEAQVCHSEEKVALLKAQTLALSHQALEHEKVSLKLAGALQDTSKRLAAAESRVEEAEQIRTTSECCQVATVAQFERTRSQAHSMVLLIGLLVKDNRTLRRVTDAAKSKVDVLMCKVAETQTHLQQLYGDLNNSQEKNSELQDSVRLAKAREADADVNMREMEEEMIRQDEVLNQCRTEIAQWQTQFTKLNIEIAEKNELLRDAREHAAGAAATAASAEQRSAELLQRLADLEAVSVQRTAQIEGLRLQLDIREHECREHRVTAAAHAGTAEARERSLAQVNSLLAAMNAKVSTMRKESDRLKADKRDFLVQINSLEGQLACREHDLDSTCQVVKDLQGLVTAHESALALAERARMQRETQAEDDQKVINGLKQQLCDCKQQLQVLIDDRNSSMFTIQGKEIYLRKQLLLAQGKAHFFKRALTVTAALHLATVMLRKTSEARHESLQTDLQCHLEQVHQQMNMLKKDLMDQKLSQQQAIAELEASRESAIRECLHAQERLELLAQEKHNAQVALDVVQQERDHLKNLAGYQQVHAARRVAALNTALTEAEKSSSELQEDLTELKVVFDQQKAAISELRVRDEVAAEMEAKSKRDWDNLQADMAAKALELQHMISAIAELKGLNESLKDQHKRDTDLLATSIKDKLEIQQQFQALEQHVDQLMTSITFLESQRACKRLELPSRDAGLRSNLSNLQYKVHQLENLLKFFLALLVSSNLKESHAQAQLQVCKQALDDVNLECEHLASQIRGRDTHLLHLEQRVAELSSTIHNDGSSLPPGHELDKGISIRPLSAAHEQDLEDLLRSLRHDAERSKASALLDQQQRFQGDLAVAAGRERTVREDRDFLMRQQQQQLDQIEALQELLENSKSAHETVLRELRAITAERDLAVEQLTELQDVVEAEQSLGLEYENLEKQLDKSRGIIEQLLQQIGELEKTKADHERLLAGYEATMDQVRTQRDHAMHLVKHPTRCRRHAAAKLVHSCTSSKLAPSGTRSAAVNRKPLKVQGFSALDVKLRQSIPSPQRFGFGFLEVE
eukprot:jgi/Botrbrau1/21209/Bobra.39_2s0010.1